MIFFLLLGFFYSVYPQLLCHNTAVLGDVFIKRCCCRREGTQDPGAHSGGAEAFQVP